MSIGLTRLELSGGRCQRESASDRGRLAAAIHTRLTTIFVARRPRRGHTAAASPGRECLVEHVPGDPIRGCCAGTLDRDAGSDTGEVITWHDGRLLLKQPNSGNSSPR